MYTHCPSWQTEVELSEDEVIIGAFACPECNLEIHIEQGVPDKTTDGYVLKAYLLTNDGERCYSVAKSPPVNRNCIRSGWFFLLGWGSFFLGAKATFWFGLAAFSYQISLIASVFGLLAILLSIWFAFRGLRESSIETGFRVGGRWRAIAAMLMSVLVLFGFGKGFYDARVAIFREQSLPDLPGDWVSFPEETV
ncbi:MAG: hypothetical protein WA705_21270 [Candidatus Ozemobacteraceae bacterium]